MSWHSFLHIVKKEEFGKTVSTYAGASIVEKSIPILLLPILTRLLSTFDYGIIATVNAVRGALDPVISMSTPGAVGRAYFDRDKPEFDFNSYTYNALVINGSLLILAFFVLLSIQSYIPGISEVGIPWLVFILIYVWAAATGGIKVKLWVYQRKPRSYGMYNVLKTLVNVSLSIILVGVFIRSWEGRVLGIGLTELAFSLIALYVLFKSDGLNFRINFNYIKDILKFGLPLILHSVGMIAISTADKLFLNALVGVSATGVYGVGYVLGSSLIFLAAPVDMSAEPIIYSRLGHLDEESALRMVIYSYLYFLVLILMALGIWIMAPVILKVLVHEKFYGAKDYVLWISLGYAAFGMRRLMTKYITYSKKTYLITLSTVMTAVVAVVANYFLIKENGAIGAAQATFVALITNFVLTWVMAMKLYPLPWFRIFKPNAIKNIPVVLNLRNH